MSGCQPEAGVGPGDDHQVRLVRQALDEERAAATKARDKARRKLTAEIAALRARLAG